MPLRPQASLSLLVFLALVAGCHRVAKPEEPAPAFVPGELVVQTARPELLTTRVLAGEEADFEVADVECLRSTCRVRLHRKDGEADAAWTLLIIERLRAARGMGSVLQSIEPNRLQQPK